MNPFSTLSWRFLRVWKRNLIVYRRTWQVNFLAPLLEPALYILSFGLGIGGMVQGVSYHGQNVSYTAFIAPALIASAVMWNAFFETTYSSFVRMFYQKTFDAMLATPLTIQEIMVAEIVWAATKSLIASVLMFPVLAGFGLVAPWAILVVAPMAFIGGLVFGGLGLYFTGRLATIELFNLPIFLFITPMFLFSGTFFPLENLPAWAQAFAVTTPLYHITETMRQACLGHLGPSTAVHFAYAIAAALVFTAAAVRSMKKRLIK